MSARTSMSGLLPSTIVCGNEPDISQAMLQNGGVKRLIQNYSNTNEGQYNSIHREKPSVLSRRPGLTNGERSSDSDDSDKSSSRRSGSGATTSGKEASPGYEESSGSEQSSGPPVSEEAKSDRESNYETVSNGSIPRSTIPRSKTTPALNGGWGLDDALKSLSQQTGELAATSNGDLNFNDGLTKIRAAHELNMSKLVYLEALFQRAKLEEARLKNGSVKKPADDTSDNNVPITKSPDETYKTLPPLPTEHGMKSSISGPSLSSLTSRGTCGSTLPDGQALLRTIESRLQLARAQETRNSRSLYQTGSSCSAGSLSHIATTQPSPSPSGASTPGRYTSPSRPPDPAGGTMAALSRPLTISTSSTALATPSPSSTSTTSTIPSTAPKRPDGLGSQFNFIQGSQRSLPHNYRSRSAYSSPAVSPQRGPDPGMIISPSNMGMTVNRRFSSLDTRSRSETRNSVRHLPLRHTTYGFPGSVLPLSPPSPAQGAQALQCKMKLFLDIMETQARFSKVKMIKYL